MKMKKSNLYATIDARLHKKLKKWAIRENMTVNKALEILLKDYFLMPQSPNVLLAANEQRISTH